MMQGYGLSEATPIISSNSLDKHKLGSSGHLVTPLELKIVDTEHGELPVGEKGEIIIKGENVMKGYWKNPEATRDAIRDGWLYTGDMGYMDEDGFLYVLGRYKSLLIGHDGEKYSPEAIEETLSEKSRFIEQLMLHNNQDPYTIGLLFPNKEALKRELAERSGGKTGGQPASAEKKSGKTVQREPDNQAGQADQTDQPVDESSRQTEEMIDQALDIIRAEIDQYREGGEFTDHFPDRWLPSAVGILPEGFAEENKMMNSTMKIVRGRITDHYEELIEYLYLPQARDIRHARNREAMKKLLGG